MRVITGKARGRKLKEPNDNKIRPTTDMVKESVFNIIQAYLPCGVVLDLFAGSGALGLEALSRGAERAVFVDNNAAAVDVIRKNAANLKLDCSEISIVKRDFITYMQTAADKFDIIFLDPPYNMGYLGKATDAIREHKILQDNGILVVESEVGGEDIDFAGFEVVTQKKYGRIQITILRCGE